MNLLALKKRWLALFLPELPTQKTVAAFDLMVSKYNEPHRHYHNLEHIQACLHYFDDVRNLIEYPLAMEAAIWFHDVIYRPMGFGNERKSAEYARDELLKLGFTKYLVKTVVHLILATVHLSKPNSFDEKYMVDIDLAVLGSDSQAYDQYEKKVRMEYGWVPDFIYGRQRKKLLKSFLSRQPIYHTLYFADKFEKNAVQNIERAVRDVE
jgi:predicted metal-dependent HD superfamily phosphohydrolase